MKIEVDIKEYRDCIGGFGIQTRGPQYRIKYLRVTQKQKDQYIKDFGLEELKSYEDVVDWLIINFFSPKKY